MREINDERPLRRRVQRKRQVDLVGLQIEHRVAVCRLEVFDLPIEDRGNVLGHFDAHARPGARSDVLVEIRRFAGQRGDAQHLGAFDPVDRGFSRLVLGVCGAGKKCRRPSHSSGE